MNVQSIVFTWPSTSLVVILVLCPKLESVRIPLANNDMTQLQIANTPEQILSCMIEQVGGYHKPNINLGTGNYCLFPVTLRVHKEVCNHEVQSQNLLLVLKTLEPVIK